MKRTSQFQNHAVLREDRDDGTILLRSAHALGPVVDKTADWLHRWANEAPDRVFIAERSGASWRKESYAATLQKVRAVAQSLLVRGMGPDTPVIIMSGNGVDHGILSLAAQYIGVPTAPVAEQYSLIHGAHGRLVHAIEVIHPTMAYVVDADQSYAAERVQGRGPDGGQVALDQHADVQRMPDEIDGLALSGRAIAHLAFVIMEKGEAPDLVEFLTPVAKVYCTEAGMRGAELGMQVLGGYGYLREYRVEQTYRAARVTAIYEGANGIHQKMLATRLALSAAGEAFETFAADELAAFQDDKIAIVLDKWREMRSRVAQASDLAHDFMHHSTAVLLACVWARIKNAAPQHADPSRIERLCAAQ